MTDVIVLVLGTGFILLMAAYAALCDRIEPRPQTRIHTMLDLIIGGVVSSGLLIYLVWALVRPEDF